MEIVEFSKITGKLKGLERTGWTRAGVPKPESVAEHTFSTTLLTMLFAKRMKLNQLKAMKMALIHDVGEAIIGDMVTDRFGHIDRKLLRKKRVMELGAIKQIFDLVEGDEFVALFDELEKGKTPEARLVKQLDKLEMALQAHQYERKYHVDLEEFYHGAFPRIKDKELRRILTELYSTRPKASNRK